MGKWENYFSLIWNRFNRNDTLIVNRFSFLCGFEIQVFPYSTRVAKWVRSLDLTAHTSLSPIRRGFVPNFVNYKKGCTRLAAASDIVYQLLAQGWWFSLGTPASSTTKTGRHDIAESGIKHQNSNSFLLHESLFDYENINKKIFSQKHQNYLLECKQWLNNQVSL